MQLQNIKKEHILQAINELDENGIPAGRDSLKYDVFFNGKQYPPPLLLSIAHRFATGDELETSSFKVGIGTPAFNLLEKEGFKINKKETFTWVDTHFQLVDFLKHKRSEQGDLIDILRAVGISGLHDEHANGERFDLEEIDPFSFFCYIYKYGPKRRLKYLQDIARHLNLKKPSDEKGIPSVQPLMVCLFPFEHDRNKNEINRLWDLFDSALEDSITDEQFADVLKINGTGKTKLTESLFNIKPSIYFPINGPTKPYLKEELGVDPKFNTFSEYLEILEKIKQKSNLPFYELSYDAWHWNKNQKVANYWIFQGNPLVFDFESALREKSLTDWTVSAHKDKINKGDKVILWITGKKSGCYALAEVESKPHIKTTSPDDHLWKQEDTSVLKADIKITHNLIDEPILKESIDAIEELNDIKVGNQGTNFSATEIEYEILKQIAEMGGKTNYWIYAPGDNARLWDEFFDAGIMGLGWDELGDISQYKSKDEVVSALQTIYDTKGSKKNDATANWDFLSSIKEGDIIIPKKGKKEYLGYGIVTSAYYYDENRNEYQKSRKVNWVKKGVWEEEDQNIVLKTLTDITKYPDYVTRLKELIGIGEKTPAKQDNETEMPLNTILYGPPGIGKTYSTINSALIKLGVNIRGLTRSEVLTEFNKSVNNGRIVFTTFHQSMSYEDFIEGIKPISNDGEISYEVVDGIFKRLSNTARFAHLKTLKDSAIERFVDFDTLYDQYVDNIEIRLNNLKETESLKLPLRTKGFYTMILSLNTDENYFLTRGGRASTDTKVRKENLRLLYNKFNSVAEIIDISNDIRSVGPGLGWSSNYFGIFKDLKDFESQQSKSISYSPQSSTSIDYTNPQKIKQILNTTSKINYDSNSDAFVLIIDEINRGNVSAIFGELITLIEDDKRLGNKEAIRVTLPYSKDAFGVPNNLHIIGTMNTADRSVEALDSALRRRFSFVELRPKPELLAEIDDNARDIEEVDLVELLKTINERIELVLDKDHQIGHSYFIGVDGITSLKEVFVNKVFPLLEEYFFGDFGKIGLIVGGSFIEEVSKDNKVKLASNFKYDDANFFSEKKVYKYTDSNTWSAEAFQSIYVDQA